MTPHASKRQLLGFIPKVTAYLLGALIQVCDNPVLFFLQAFVDMMKVFWNLPDWVNHTEKFLKRQWNYPTAAYEIDFLRTKSED